MLKKIVFFIALIFLFLFIGYKLIDEPVPKGTTGQKAEYLAERMLEALNYKAWVKIGAIQWSYPRGHNYLWDKKENLVRVSWDDYVVLLNPETQTGKAFKAGVETESTEMISKAFSLFANDSFWLIAPFKVNDPGTIRKAVLFEENDALLVQYTSGGVTPGDSYLWLFDEEGKPNGWKLWVSIIPIGGIKYSWEKWQTHAGAELSTMHSGLIDIEITDLKTANSVEELNNGINPFENL